MSTLSNVAVRGGETLPPSVRLAPGTIPEAKSSRTGVSVKYVPNENKNWFVFRASYGRENKAADIIVEDGTYVYVAKRYAYKTIKGKQKRFLETLIPNILFVYTTKEKAEEYTRKTPSLSFLTYYYDHFVKNEDRTNPPLTVSCREMENFIMATCSNSEHLKFVNEAECHFKSGEVVLVIGGPFKGVTGKVARLAGQQRVIVSLSHVGFISTAYIPTAFIQVVDGVDKTRC